MEFGLRTNMIFHMFLLHNFVVNFNINMAIAISSQDISEADNIFLKRDTNEENQTVKWLCPLKAQEPDGMHAILYQNY